MKTLFLPIAAALVCHIAVWFSGRKMTTLFAASHHPVLIPFDSAPRREWHRWTAVMHCCRAIRAWSIAIAIVGTLIFQAATRWAQY